MDGVTTRTLMGAAYPLPGLYSKFFDVDMDPLVQVVRDTVGRHDTFGLACTRRYYEDMGYPGHISCTENFNGQVTPYGIAARAGWEAVNFFFNTRVDADNVIVSDEPWSRPGDYVLMRAMTDLVCASSACPDDIDPANGWDITDIHVRVYSPENRFSTAIAHRVTPEAEPVLTKETAFHPRTSKLTESFVEYRGYWLPQCYNTEGAIDRVLGVPREGRGDGPLAAAQVGGARPGRRGADPAGDHARRAAARDRAGGLHGRLQRDRRHDRRRHRLPARRQQLPIHRRRPVHGRVAEGAGRAARPEGVGEALDRPARTTSRCRGRRAARS